MGLAMLYGGQEVVKKSDSREVAEAKIAKNTATQIIVWEIALGWREATAPYKLVDDSFIRRFADGEDGVLVWCGRVSEEDFRMFGIQDAYNRIAEKMAKHYEIPSFMSRRKEIGFHRQGTSDAQSLLLTA